jgi:hypothetical protein
MSSTIPAHADHHSGLPQKVDGMLRIRWTASTGFSGRHAPDSLAAMDRITHWEEKFLSLASLTLHIVH